MTKGVLERIQGVIGRGLNSGDLQRAGKMCGQMCGERVGDTQGVVAEEGSVNFSVVELQSLNTDSI